MAITNLALPTLMADLDSGEFGALEKRESHYGALNTYYRNARQLFGDKLVDQIQTSDYRREIKIPIFARGADQTLLTARSCDITCNPDTTVLKTLTNVHLRGEICINQDDYNLNYVSYEQALKDRFLKLWRSIYKNLDAMCAAHIDSNKSTNIAADPNGGPYANPLYKAFAGSLEFVNSNQFYAYLPAVLQMWDMEGTPLLDLANTVVNADKTYLNAGGPGALIDSNSLMAGAGISQYDYSNRVASGSMVPTHYIAPVGSLGIVNNIDMVYQRQPQIGSSEDIAFWNANQGLVGVSCFRQMIDPVFPDFKWGVLQKVDCVDEQILYSAAFSANFYLATGFTTETGLTPIKKMTVKNLYQPTYPAAA